MRRSRSAVLGLDLSARAAAAIAVPLNWNGEWVMTRTLVVGEKLTVAADDVDKALRTGSIAEQLCRFAFDYGVGHAWIENLAFGMRSKSSHMLAQLDGVVRLELVRMGIEIHTANMGTARKLLVGTVKRTGQKKLASKLAFRALQAAGMPIRFGKDTKLDETDAFVAANLGLSELGAYCFAQHSER